jgi:acyl-coenzyme A synthetase/AMP-(fatty) acid ligase
MPKLVLFTSGSTTEAKEVSHEWDFIDKRIDISIAELQLTSADTVLNVLPFNVIGYHTIMSGPAIKARATLINTVFDPYSYIRLFNKYQPALIALIPKHVELLMATKGFNTLDMSCVRYMVMGSQAVPQSMIDMLLGKGVKLIANWYGSTENPPPVAIAYNSSVFDFKETYGYKVEFASDGECIVNGIGTGDIFSTDTHEYIRRKENATNRTWKS